MAKGEDTSPHTACSDKGASCVEGDKGVRTNPAMNFQKPRALAYREAKELPSESEEMEPRASNSTSNHRRSGFGY